MAARTRFYVEAPLHQSRGLQRIEAALTGYVPEWAEVVADWRLADVVVLHVIGRLEATLRRAAEIAAEGKRYAVVQYAVRSTQKPDEAAWRPLWDGATAVWSTYRLGTDRLYHAPFGVGGIFRQQAHPPIEKQWAVLTSGFSWLTEGVKECALAVQAAGGRVLHLGPEMSRPWVDCVDGITDAELASYYRASAYVCALRRVEGFELPAAEGLVCGARPICFYKSHYRDWYGDWAEYVDEAPRPVVQDELNKLFAGPYRPVTEAERLAAAARFDWAKLVPAFYGRMVTSGQSSSVRVRSQQRERPRLPQGRRA